MLLWFTLMNTIEIKQKEKSMISSNIFLSMNIHSVTKKRKLLNMSRSIMTKVNVGWPMVFSYSFSLCSFIVHPKSLRYRDEHFGHFSAYACMHTYIYTYIYRVITLNEQILFSVSLLSFCCLIMDTRQNEDKVCMRYSYMDKRRRKKNARIDRKLNAYMDRTGAFSHIWTNRFLLYKFLLLFIIYRLLTSIISFDSLSYLKRLFLWLEKYTQYIAFFPWL